MSNSNPKPIASESDDQKRLQFRNPGQRPESPSGSSSADPPPPASETTSCLGSLSATAAEGSGDVDGFKTPTDSVHRVPEARLCPPAPQKPAAHLKTRVKRKNSPGDATWMSHGRRISILLDLSEEVESMFPAKSTRKIKKARTI